MSKNSRKWRKEVKKLQRKKRRRKAAQERDQKLKEEEEAKLKDPVHQQWLQQQAALKEAQRLVEERKQAEQEEAWLRQDLLLQRQFRLVQKKRAEAEAAQETQRLQQEKQREAQQEEKHKQEMEKERLKAEAAAEFDHMLASVEKYLNSDSADTAPAELNRTVESRPGEKLCDLYERTNCCRYGAACLYSHRRPLLANIILVHHFFVHPALEQSEHMEYASADTLLESSEHDLREDYDNFFYDVVPELERFGKIKNFRVTRNVQRHLRGHVFVEYTNRRSALKAFINLQGRYYAARRLNVEFSNIVTWRSGVCGLALTRKCARGHNCNYLHLFRNPGNKYNTSLEVVRTPGMTSERHIVATNVTPLLSWNDMTPMRDSQRQWRWSESPEIEMKRLHKNVEQLREEWEHNKTGDSEEHCSREKRVKRSKERKDKNKKSTKEKDENDKVKHKDKKKHSSKSKHSKRSDRKDNHHKVKKSKRERASLDDSASRFKREKVQSYDDNRNPEDSSSNAERHSQQSNNFTHATTSKKQYNSPTESCRSRSREKRSSRAYESSSSNHTDRDRKLRRK